MDYFEEVNITTCDECCKEMCLISYYNQDGLCVECFKKWMAKDE